MVAQGIERIKAGWGQPASVLKVAGRDAAHITAEDFSFGVAPLLNASGRLVDIAVGTSAMAPDFDTALPLATELHKINQERRNIERKCLIQHNRARWLFVA